MDSGASNSFIGEAFCQQVDLKHILTAIHTQVRLADGSTMMTSRKCEVSLTLQGVKLVNTCHIVPLLKEFDLIFGDRWLKVHGVALGMSMMIALSSRASADTPPSAAM